MKISITRLRESSVIFLFYWIPLQDLVAAFMFQAGTPAWSIRTILLLKEGIIIFWGVSMLLLARGSMVRVLLVGFLAYSFLFVFVSKLEIYYSLIGFRTYLMLVFSYIVGESLSTDEAFVRRFTRHASVIFLLVIGFAFFEYILRPSFLWTRIFPVIHMKNAILGLGVPEYFSTGLPENINGEVTRRMIGPFNEPLNMAYFTVILLNFITARLLLTTDKRSWSMMLGIVAIFLSQTRAVIIGYLLSIIAVIFKGQKMRLRHVVLIAGGAIVGTIVVVLFVSWFTALGKSIFSSSGRNITHLLAYSEGLFQLIENPFGQGVGVSSNSVGFATDNLSTENSFINIGLEVGLLGLLWFLTILSLMIFRFWRFLNEGDKLTVGYRVVGAGYMLLIQFAFAGLVAPHIMTARVLIPFMLVMGWSYKITFGFAASRTPDTDKISAG